MAEEPMDATSSVLPASSGTKMETTQREDVVKASDVPVEETVSGSAAEEAVDHVGAPEATKTNGEAGHGVKEPPDETSEPVHKTEDTEMKDIGDAEDPAGVTSSPAVPPSANGTPSMSKRASNGGSSKKKTSAVPEHKTKKLNKKKSKPLTNLNAQPGEYFFARMKGHPPWPSIICDEEMLPQSLLSTRPVTAMLPDKTFKKEEYADGGKRAYERTFPVMFLHTNEFAWIPNTELTPLETDADSTKNPSEKGKSKLLLSAYAKAAEANDLSHFKTMLAEHQKALQEDQAEREERAAKKASKKSRKSSDAAALAEDDDEMDVDEDMEAEKPKSKKRKKADDSDADEKPAKTPKTATKLKLTTPKAPATESASKKKASKPKAKGPKSGSEDDAATPKTEEKPLTPAAAKEIKEKKVLYYRHKLQRGFLSRDTVPKEDEMKSMSDFLAELETYNDLDGSIIRATKIHKVLKAIIKLQSIPLEEQFNFKSRSTDLLAKWNDILASDGTSGEKADEKADGKAEENNAAPVTNGDAKSTEEQAQKAEAGEAAAPEEQTQTQLENKIGTTVEGEKEIEQPTAEEAKPEKTAEETETDGPAVDSAPAEEYIPPTAEEVVEATA